MLLKRINVNSKKALKSVWSKSIALTIFIIGCWFFIGLLCKQASNVFIYNYAFSLTTNPVLNILLVVFIFLVTALSIMNITLFYTGVKKFSINIVNGNYSSLKNVFYFLIHKNLRTRAQKLAITLFFLKFLNIIIWNLPTIIYSVFLLVISSSVKPNTLIILLVIACVVCFFSTIIAIYKNNIYFVAHYLFINNTHLLVSQILALSKKILIHEKRNIFKYYVRKIPSSLTYIFIFPIFYFYPKHIISDALYAKFLIEKYNKSIILSVPESL